MTMFPNMFSLPKYPSDDICGTCKARNSGQGNEKQNLKTKGTSQDQTTMSKTTVNCLGTIILLAVFLLLLFRYLYPAGIIGVRDTDQTYLYARSNYKLTCFPNFGYSGEEDVQPVMSEPWKFVINPENICIAYNTDAIELLILVTSSLENFQRRQAIRNTWGSLTTKKGPYRLGFIVGYTLNLEASLLLQEESEKYGDIIQGDFEDTYENLTLKSIAMLKWVSEFCPHAKFFLKADDDIYVNFQILSEVLNNETYSSDANFIIGSMQNGLLLEADSEPNYDISDDSSEDLYPPYISGSVYLTTGHLAKGLYEATLEVEPLISIADVYITGLCAQKIGAVLIHDDLFHSDKPQISWDTYKYRVTSGGLEPDDIHKLWEEMTVDPVGLENEGNKTSEP